MKDQKVLYNAVDDAFFADDVKKEKQIINVGTYCKRKDQIKALEAFYVAQLPEYRLVLIGSAANDYYKLLKKRKAELEQTYGQRDVEILAAIPREETIRLVKQSQVYLLTSISEMFPVSLIEGMAAGCSWVSTDVGIDCYLPGGKIADTPQEIAAALRYVTAEENYAGLATASRDFAKANCSKQTQVDKLENILAEAVEHRKRGKA